jgi:hypothetical protein
LYFVFLIISSSFVGSHVLGPACNQFERWASSKGIEVISSVGRDMGAAPPRQTEVKFNVPGGVLPAILSLFCLLILGFLFLRAFSYFSSSHVLDSYEQQLNTALTAYPALNVTDIPQEYLKTIRGQCSPGLVMSVCVSSSLCLFFGFFLAVCSFYLCIFVFFFSALLVIECLTL